MKCPLLTGAYIIGTQAATTSGIDCLKEKCAWWDNLGIRCGVMSLVERLGWINRSISEIVKGGK